MTDTTHTATGHTTAGGPAPRLCLLGRFRLECGADTADVCLNGQRLLAYLGLRGHASRTLLAGALWSGSTEERALGSLRTTLWRLHREQPPLVRISGGSLSLTDAVQVDVQALNETALRLVRTPCGSPPENEPALDLLLGGDLLPGWDDEWVLPERERLRQLQLHALEAAAEAFIADGRHALALEAALESVRREPLRESAHRAVVAVHLAEHNLAEHNLAEAVTHFRAFRRLVRTELGVEPSGQFLAMMRHAFA